MSIIFLCVLPENYTNRHQWCREQSSLWLGSHFCWMKLYRRTRLKVPTVYVCIKTLCVSANNLLALCLPPPPPSLPFPRSTVVWWAVPDASWHFVPSPTGCHIKNSLRREARRNTSSPLPPARASQWGVQGEQNLSLSWLHASDKHK